MGSQSLPWPLVYDHPQERWSSWKPKVERPPSQGQPLICGLSSACSTYTTLGSCQPEPKDSLRVKGPGFKV